MTGLEFRRSLRRCGITQSRFARLWGVSANTVSLWATNKRRVPTPVARMLRAHLDRRININALEASHETPSRS